jgi:hypothetical protein
MYGKASAVGLTGSAGILAVTGFGLAFYLVVASILILSGLVLARFGRRRAAHR